MAYTFTTDTKQCYLKNGIPPASRCDRCISGAAIYRQATVERGLDRFGGDYEHRQLLEPKPELCRLACAQDPRCKAYTFTSYDGVCHLKDSVPSTSSCSQCTSGVVQPRTFSFEPNSDRRQSDYLSFENPLSDPEICRLACAQDQRCTTYVYKKPGYQGNTALCFLKQQTPGLFSDSCCISGVSGR
jgi:1-phosphatidylinositol phosphodiesterase